MCRAMELSALDASCEFQSTPETVDVVADAKVTKRRWSKAEDMMIVKQRRSGASWDRIAAQLDQRTADGVRLRWHRVKRDSALLMPLGGESTCPIGKREKNIQVWTEDEDALILEGVLRFGQQWREITKLLPGRTDSSVRQRFTRLMKKDSAQSTSPSMPVEEWMSAEDDRIHVPSLLSMIQDVERDSQGEAPTTPEKICVGLHNALPCIRNTQPCVPNALPCVPNALPCVPNALPCVPNASRVADVPWPRVVSVAPTYRGLEEGASSMIDVFFGWALKELRPKMQLCSAGFDWGRRVLARVTTWMYWDTKAAPVSYFLLGRAFSAHRVSF